MDCDITLVTSNAPKITGLSRCEQILTSLISKKINVKLCPLKQLEKPSRFMRYFYFLKNLIGIDLKSNKDSQSILHFLDQNQAIFLNFAPIKQKIIVTVYDIFPISPKCWKRWSLIEKLRFWLVYEGVKKADKIITISEYMKKKINTHLNIPLEKIGVFYEGRDSKYVPRKRNIILMNKYNLLKNKQIILYVGSEQTRKNFRGVIKAFKLINDKLPETILLKVGEPLWQKEREKNLNLIKKLNLEKKIIFTDYVQETALPELYNLSDLFMSLTLAEGGAALPIIEAMACGKPILTSDIPVLRETVKNAAIFVPPYDYKKAAKEAIRLLQNEKLALEFGHRALKRSKFFSWEKAASKIVKIYREFE